MVLCVLKASVSVSINIFDWPLTNTWLISWSPLDQHLYWRSVDQLICIDQYSMRCLWKISRLSTNVRLRCWSSVIRVSTDVFIKYWSSVDQGSVRVNRGCRSKVSINTRRCMHLVYMIWSLLLKNLSFNASWPTLSAVHDYNTEDSENIKDDPEQWLVKVLTTLMLNNPECSRNWTISWVAEGSASITSTYHYIYDLQKAALISKKHIMALNFLYPHPVWRGNLWHRACRNIYFQRHWQNVVPCGCKL